MADESTKTGVPTRTFTDAGSGETFTEGKPHGFEPGAHANYLHAGLIAEPDADAAPAPAAQPAADHSAE